MVYLMSIFDGFSPFIDGDMEILSKSCDQVIRTIQHTRGRVPKCTPFQKLYLLPVFDGHGVLSKKCTCFTKFDDWSLSVTGDTKFFFRFFEHIIMKSPMPGGKPYGFLSKRCKCCSDLFIVICP